MPFNLNRVFAIVGWIMSYGKAMSKLKTKSAQDKCSGLREWVLGCATISHLK
jgi:hypothetical protein